MLQTSVLILALAASSFGVYAQTAPASASTPAKRDLITRILKLQQPGIEQMARQLAEEPAEELMARAAAALPQRVPAERQQQVARDIEGDLKKYADEVVPIVRAAAIRAAPGTVGTLLEQKFTEDELRQVAQIIENPVYVKFQALGPEMQRVLADKLVADTRNQVSPKVKALEESIGKRLGITAAPAAAPASRR